MGAWRLGVLVVLMVSGGVWGQGWAQAPARVERRVALVIGMAEYRTIDRLRNPANDAGAMASTLAGLGFQVVGGGALLDLDRDGLHRAIQKFGEAIADADVSLFYFSGHGLQMEGKNWLVPVDANPVRLQDVDFQMLDADLVLRQMERAGTRLNVMILDACRNNPFGVRGVRGGAGRGLAEMKAPEGTIISYATQPGNVAGDGAGANSPYTAALVQQMARPGVPVLSMFNAVGVAVKRGTGGVQQPWLGLSPIEGDFSFSPAQGAGATNLVLAPPRVADEPVRPRVETAVPVRPPGSLAEQRGRGQQFAEAYFGTWSSDDATAAAFVRSVYAPQVEFYGKGTARGEIVTAKVAYLQRWPVRRYALRLDTLGVSCAEGGAVCTVSGVVDWMCASPQRNARASGAANFSLRVDLSAQPGVILMEAGSVLARR